MNNNRRRNFRSRQQKSNFLRRRNGSSSTSSFNNGNINFSRNGSMNNSHNVEKTMQKFQQLAKDAQSNADHYLRRLNELTDKKENFVEKNKISESSTSEESLFKKKLS